MMIYSSLSALLLSLFLILLLASSLSPEQLGGRLVCEVLRGDSGLLSLVVLSVEEEDDVVGDDFFCDVVGEGDEGVFCTSGPRVSIEFSGVRSNLEEKRSGEDQQRRLSDLWGENTGEYSGAGIREERVEELSDRCGENPGGYSGIAGEEDEEGVRLLLSTEDSIGR